MWKRVKQLHEGLSIQMEMPLLLPDTIAMHTHLTAHPCTHPHTPTCTHTCSSSSSSARFWRTRLADSRLAMRLQGWQEGRGCGREESRKIQLNGARRSDGAAPHMLS